MKQKDNLPTDVFRNFVIALKNDDLEKMKLHLSETTLETVKTVCSEREIPFRAGFNLVSRLYGQRYDLRFPETRNEIIGSDAAACLEVEDLSSGKFNTFIFLKENNQWKFAPEMIFQGVEFETVEVE
jgi:hypothetical protein